MRKAAATVVLGITAIILLQATGLLGSRRSIEEAVPAVRVQIEMLGIALDGFRPDVGRHPTTDEGLRALRHRPDGLETWRGPYLTKEVPADPWGRPYRYRSAGDRYEVSSLGGDGAPGGSGNDADVVGTSPGP
jgi:general secretion pathway protein G